MPTWNFKPADKLENTVLELIKQMGWMFSKLDSKNVKRLDTNETTIKSADGTTYIHGPVLEMRDASTQMRLIMGYDSSTGKFIFQLYDADGNLTIDLNDLGEAVFKGNIETAKNATIGEILKLVSGSSEYTSGIKWMDNDGLTEMATALVINTSLLTTLVIKALVGDMDIVVQDGNLNLTSINRSVILKPGAMGIACIGSAVAGNRILTENQIDAKIESAVNSAIDAHENNDVIYNSHVEP
jgi:hypothetical protein